MTNWSSYTTSLRNEDHVVAMFELALVDGHIKVVEERHYMLVPARDLEQKVIRCYTS